MHLSYTLPDIQLTDKVSGSVKCAEAKIYIARFPVVLLFMQLDAELCLSHYLGNDYNFGKNSCG